MAMKGFKKIIFIFCCAAVFLSSCKSMSHSDENVSTGEEYGLSEPGWR